MPNLSEIYFVTYGSVFGNDIRPEVQAFMDKFKAKFNKMPVTSHAITGYSVIEAWSRAVERAGTFDTDKVRDALQTFKDEPLLAGPDHLHRRSAYQHAARPAADRSEGRQDRQCHPGGARGEDAAIVRRHCRSDVWGGPRMTSTAVAREIATASALETADVVVNFQGLRAIDRVSLRLDSGEMLGLIGPNGAGKTTLVNVLTGFQEADSGSVHLGGEDIGRWMPHERSRRGLVRTFQNVLPFAGLTALENVEAGAMATGLGRAGARRRAMEVLDWLGLAARAHRKVDTLPFGEERRVGIARAVAMAPQFLLMDEPAAGLNDAECEDLKLVVGRIRRELGLRHPADRAPHVADLRALRPHPGAAAGAHHRHRPAG